MSSTPLLRRCWYLSYFPFFQFALSTSILFFWWNFDDFKCQTSLLASLTSSNPMNVDTIHKLFTKYFEVCWNSPMLWRLLLVNWVDKDSFGWLCFTFIGFPDTEFKHNIKKQFILSIRAIKHSNIKVVSEPCRCSSRTETWPSALGKFR